MQKPIVAVVGRPNVGKSSFFNRVAGKRISIVEDTPGVTRDRIYADADWAGKAMTLVDTGGISLDTNDQWREHILAQAELAIDMADVIVFILDGKQAITHEDQNVAQILRKSKKPIVVAVNKLDTLNADALLPFYELGLGTPIGMSCQHGLGIGDVLDAVVSNFSRIVPFDEEDTTIKVALVGRPNVGKSSMTNRLLGQNRVVVSNIAGTTRDAIDVPFKYNNKDYILIDTAGIRRKSKIDYNSIEGYSVMRSLGAIRRADVVVYVLDAAEEISEQDVRVLGYIHEQGKPSVVVYNKWDLIQKDTHTVELYKRKLAEALKFMDYFVVQYISTLDGTRFGKVMESVEYVLNNAKQTIQTSTLNDIIHDAVYSSPPPTKMGHSLKINYATQVGTLPPTFILFVNNPDLMHFSYLRYIENCLRKAKNFEGTPIKLIIRAKSKEAK